MNRIGPIVWRGYLTVLILMVLAFIFAFGSNSIDAYKHIQNRKTLLAYFEVNHGRFNDKDAPSVDGDWIDITPADVKKENLKNLTDEQLDTLIKAEMKGCLQKLLKNGGDYHFWCNGQTLPNEMSKLGLSPYSKVWPTYITFDISFKIFAWILLLLLARYWGAWFILGQRPKRFP